jgi:hypothetical protein
MATGWPMKTTYANGDVYSASDVNDITGTINLLGSSVAYAAGKNKIINGDMNIWQRGTTFTPSSTGFFYTADRWVSYCYSASTNTVSQQAFTVGTAPATPYESQYFIRVNSTNTLNLLEQRIENVRNFANQNVTISFWAKSASAQTITIYLSQVFGSGGSAGVDTSSTKAITTSWARYSVTLTMPSISGKTIGTGSYLANTFTGAINNALDIWGVQVEQGSTATAFQTATGTIQGELAACQRYYFRFTGPGAYSAYAFGAYGGTTTGYILMDYPVTFRTTPSSLDYANLAVQLTDGGGPVAVTNLALDQNSLKNQTLLFTVGTAGTAFRPCRLLNNNNAAGYVGLSAEL